MSKEKQEIEIALKNVHDTTTIVKKFAKLLEKHESDGIEDYLREFKTLYGEYHYYNKVHDAIITETEMLGMDSEYVAKAFDEV
jgi:hypothetical protein